MGKIINLYVLYKNDKLTCANCGLPCLIAMKAIKNGEKMGPRNVAFYISTSKRIVRIAKAQFIKCLNCGLDIETVYCCSSKNWKRG